MAQGGRLQLFSIPLVLKGWRGVLCLSLRQHSDSPDRVEQIAPSQKFRQKVDSLGILECLDELHDAGVIALRTYFSFDLFQI